MSPRMWFTLILRGLGAYEFLNGLNSAVTALNVHFGYFNGSATAMAFVNHAVESCIIGAFLVLAGSRISALLVPPLPEKQDNSEPPANV